MTVLTGDMQTMQEKREPLKGGWKASIYLVGVEVAERFAIFGVSGNLITYLTEVVHESTASAAKNVNIWIGVSSLLPLLGGFVADTYLGRRKTILFASLIYMMGLVLVMLSVSLVPLRFQHVLVLLSLYLVAVGQGGHKPCVQTFGADQFDENNPEEKKAKSSFFNWWYFGISAGASAAILVVYYVQDNVGWLIGFALPAMAMALSLAIFLLGWKSYRQQVCHGSPLTQVAQVFTAAYRKRHVHYIEDGYVEIHEEGHQQPLTCSNQFKFLNKATIIDAIDELSETRNGWRLCSVAEVEEVKLLIRLTPVWLSCLPYGVIFAQGGTFFTKQGGTMNTRIWHDLQIPPASLLVFTGLAVVLTVPIYDKIFVPFARRITGFTSGISMLQRIGTGIFLAIMRLWWLLW
ncbi:hypothetical protein Sjap_008441 [Stephania japonica]|uniref:Uncharacterized protein n=1 Tax=Stephania japonica TaxID=461633 RepID=A0AAP0JPM6_9MAGN